MGRGWFVAVVVIIVAGVEGRRSILGQALHDGGRGVKSLVAGSHAGLEKEAEKINGQPSPSQPGRS